MKKGLLIIGIITAIYSCNNSDKKDAGETNIQGPVQNANGNVPDTTNSINLNTQKDTSKVSDSTKQ